MNEYLAYIDKLFTPQQQVSLVIITFSVMMLTQAFKYIYFPFFPAKNKKKKMALIWMFALTAGICGGIIGHYVAIPKQPMWFWIFIGVSAGGIAIGAFIVIVEKIWPRFKSKPLEEADG